jgi:hypothetical protein
MQERKRMSNFWLTIFCFILLPLLTYGCAGTPASYKTIQDVKEGVVLISYENLEIKTSAGAEVVMTEHEMARIVGHIKANLREKSPGCFSEICDDCSNPSTLVLKVGFTRYDKGNAFARSMLAGLGQIHIDAEVTLEDKTTKEVLAKHEVKKTFAWGGMYGGTTRIEDVEPAFAEAIVSIILQEES